MGSLSGEVCFYWQFLIAPNEQTKSLNIITTALGVHYPLDKDYSALRYRLFAEKFEETYPENSIFIAKEAIKELDIDLTVRNSKPFWNSPIVLFIGGAIVSTLSPWLLKLPSYIIAIFLMILLNLLWIGLSFLQGSKTELNQKYELKRFLLYFLCEKEAAY
jgi:hypothetical protein